MNSYTLQELANKVGGVVVGDPDRLISGIATLQTAEAGQISFLANPAYEKYLSSTKAEAVILSEASAESYSGNALVHANPYLAYAELSHCFDTVSAERLGKIHASACIHETANIAEGATVEAGVVIHEGVEVAAGAYISANCVIGNDSVIGEGSKLYPNVTVYHGVVIGKNCIVHGGTVIGSDGFGFAPENGQWHKIAQIGGVVIGDNVEIGANSAIDRGALDNTIIEDGVKLDNQIQIAHNVRIGENTAMAACSAVAGSTTIGKNCIIGGASGIAGHLTITDNVHITAMTMVIKSLTEPGVYSSGTGVQPNAKWRKSIARLRQLDQMAGRVKALEKELKAIKS